MQFVSRTLAISLQVYIRGLISSRVLHQVQKSPVRLSLGGQSREREKRQSSREPIRINNSSDYRTH